MDKMQLQLPRSSNNSSRMTTTKRMDSSSRSKFYVPQSPPQGGALHSNDDNNTFLQNNYEILESHVSDRGNIACYHVQSIFDQQFYVLKRKKVRDLGEDL